VVVHHGREGGGDGHDEARPSVFNGLLGGVSGSLPVAIARSLVT
jgi:hypothetical protein